MKMISIDKLKREFNKLLILYYDPEIEGVDGFYTIGVLHRILDYGNVSYYEFQDDNGEDLKNVSHWCKVPKIK